MIKNFDFISNLSGFFGVKDINSKIVSMTKDFYTLVGWNSEKEFFGKMDYDMPCKASEYANEFIEVDKKVLFSGNKISTIEMQNYCSGWKLILTERNTLKNNHGEITGLFCHLIDVSNVGSFKFYMDLYRIDNKILGKKLKPFSYIMSKAHSPFKLTEKQENCLFFLLRGKTIKEISKILGVSPRTTESHIDAIKNKLNCQYKSDIIEKAIDSGFLYYIPKDLQCEYRVVSH